MLYCSFSLQAGYRRCLVCADEGLPTVSARMTPVIEMNPVHGDVQMLVTHRYINYFYFSFVTYQKRVFAIHKAIITGKIY